MKDPAEVRTISGVELEENEFAGTSSHEEFCHEDAGAAESDDCDPRP